MSGAIAAADDESLIDIGTDREVNENEGRMIARRPAHAPLFDVLPSHDKP
jgi:hypothetical protein